MNYLKLFFKNRGFEKNCKQFSIIFKYFLKNYRFIKDIYLNHEAFKNILLVVMDPGR